MSLKTVAIRKQLADNLGPSGIQYWQLLAHFINGRLTKSEFEELILVHLVTPQLGK